MNTKIFTSAIVIAVVLAVPAFGGGKCKYDTQTCLDMMIEQYHSRGYVGVEYYQDEETGAVTVKAVIEDTPAESAGLRAGDQLVAINGLVFVETDEKTLYAAWKKFVPGTMVTYTILRDGKTQDIELTLAKLPEEFIARDIGMHMLEHATIVTANE